MSRAPTPPGRFAERYGQWALVTGASSGIGEAFARQLAALGLDLILVARRKDRLTRLAGELSDRHGVTVRAAPADLTEPDFLEQIQALADPLEIGLLVNNAGAALTGEFLAHELEDELSLLYLNCRAPLVLSHFYGRQMAERQRGGIINVASASGFLPMPYWTHYGATKAFDLHFSEGLAVELAASNVDVLALCPGGTHTEFSEVAGTEAGGMDPAHVVAVALAKLGRAPVAIPGLRNRVSVLALRAMPRRTLARLGASVVRGMMDKSR